jgi:hypothetical protein
MFTLAEWNITPLFNIRYAFSPHTMFSKKVTTACVEVQKTITKKESSIRNTFWNCGTFNDALSLTDIIYVRIRRERDY